NPTIALLCTNLNEHGYDDCRTSKTEYHHGSDAHNQGFAIQGSSTVAFHSHRIGLYIDFNHTAYPLVYEATHQTWVDVTHIFNGCNHCWQARYVAIIKQLEQFLLRPGLGGF